MGLLGRDEAHLLNGLASTTKAHNVALMAILLDAIGIDMHHPSTDLAAGAGENRRGRSGIGPAERSPPAWQQGLRSSPA